VLIQAIELAAFLFGQNVITANGAKQTRREGCIDFFEELEETTQIE